MSPENEQKVMATLSRLETALCGDEAMGNPGITRRLNAVEIEQREQGRKLLLWSGIATGAGVVITHLKTKWFG